MGQLFQEIKRRNVIRVAISYAVAAWLLIQVAETVFPMLRLPGWTATFVTVLLIIGFPIALIFAWAFELTPEGIKLEKHVVRDEHMANLTGRKLDFTIIAMLVVALGYFSYDKFVIDPRRDAELVQTTTKAEAGRAGGTGIAETADRSIAVLAFADLSPEGDQEYFSDGISEELLNVLSKIRGLRVAARTSSFQFKGKNRNIIDIGEQLNTAFILQGSVRKEGVQVRITAQLVDASSGFHLWSETYDRELKNIFAVQDEISAAIVMALREHLGLQVEATPRVIAAANTEAHDAYLRGRHLVVQRTRVTVEGAVREFEKAIKLDPDYALAHAELAIATVFLTAYGDLYVTEAIARATPHAERAIALDPTLAEAHAAIGYILRFQGNAEEALTHLKEAIRINPNYAIVYNVMGVLLGAFLGQYDEAFAAFETALRLDPLSIPAISNYVRELTERSRFAEADREMEKLAAIAPSYYARFRGIRMSRGGKWANYVLGELDALRSDPERVQSRNALAQAFAIIGLEQEALAISGGPGSYVLTLFGRHGDAITTAEARVAEDPISPTARSVLGLALASIGDYARARPILEELWQRSGGRITNRGPFHIYSAAALIAIRRKDGEEAGVAELVAAIRDNVRRYIAAGMTINGADFEEGLAAYLADERGTGLELMSKAVEDGFFILQNEAYLQTLYDDPDFTPIRASQEARQTRERKRFLDIVCIENPYAAVWQPAEGTCERFTAAGVN